MKARTILIILTFIAIFPMTMGSLIFWIYFFYPNNDLETFGILTFLVSILLFTMGLVFSIIFRLKSKSDFILRKKANRNLYLTLLNIPFCVFYVWFAIYLINIERITIINNTNNDITDILISGACDNNSFDKIEKGDSKVAWLHLIREGSIQMTYMENGQLKIKSLKGYTGPNMGGHWVTRHLKMFEREID